MNELEKSKFIGTNKKITMLLKVIVGGMDSDIENPTLLITYQVIPSKRGEIVRDDIRIVTPNIQQRYYGKLPVVFLRVDKEKDIDTLTCANIVKTALDDASNVIYERDINKAIKNVLTGKTLTIKKITLYGAYGEVMMRRPHVDYQPYSYATFRRIVSSENIKNGKENG